jgi:hypothetical protein
MAGQLDADQCGIFASEKSSAESSDFERRLQCRLHGRACATTHGQAEINVIDLLARAELASLRFDRARGRRPQEHFICGYLPGLM